MKKWLLIVFFMVVVLVIWQSISLYETIQAGKNGSRNKAVKIAKERYNLVKVQSGEPYYGNKAYFVVEGKNKAHKSIIVWVDEKGNTYSETKSSGLSKKEMLAYTRRNLNPKKIIDIRLGMDNDHPIWEVVYIDSNNRYTFYDGYFENGSRYKKYSIKQDI
ncbi:DUF5590 domain-containing protein [Fictibacillus gelatini]|uniref:cell wall elongation regulator TseB-like domain-containing protein n=1 Tax=Fictibacillus gelatini TaxID=225985 RepID=UPI0004206800|nr:DUF5590 domain-containing protein [Fictibacillus gelatini]